MIWQEDANSAISERGHLEIEKTYSERRGYPVGI